MTSEEATCRAFIDLINQKSFKELGELLDVSASLDYPGISQIRKKSMVIMFLRQLRAKFQQLSFEIDRITQTGGVLAIEWRNAGVKNDGTEYANQGVTMIEIVDGKIQSISDYFKHHAGLHCARPLLGRARRLLRTYLMTLP